MVNKMTMDRCGVNEYIDDDYSNSTCDCYWCKQREQLRKVLITEQDEEDITFDLVWDDTQKPEHDCECEDCMMQLNSYEGELLDIEDEIQAAEFCEVLADEVERAVIDVLYAFETAEPKEVTLKKINELMDLLQAMEYVVASE